MYCASKTVENSTVAVVAAPGYFCLFLPHGCPPTELDPMLKVIKHVITEFISPSKANKSENKMDEEEEKLFRRPDGKSMIFTSTAVGKERVKVMLCCYH